MVKLSGVRKTLAYYITQPMVVLLAKASITPSTLTWIGFLLAICATALIITGHLFAAGFVVLVTGFFDMLDGALARHTKRVTPFGAVLDSAFDRLSEGVLLFGILVLFLLAKEPSNLFSLVPREWSVLLVYLALLSSLSVSYIRARAEALGLECQVGLFTRTERVIVLVLGLLLSQIAGALVIALAIIVIFSFFAVCQRLLYVWQKTRIRQ